MSVIPCRGRPGEPGGGQMDGRMDGQREGPFCWWVWTMWSNPIHNNTAQPPNHTAGSLGGGLAGVLIGGPELLVKIIIWQIIIVWLAAGPSPSQPRPRSPSPCPVFHTSPAPPPLLSSPRSQATTQTVPLPALPPPPCGAPSIHAN